MAPRHGRLAPRPMGDSSAPPFSPKPTNCMEPKAGSARGCSPASTHSYHGNVVPVTHRVGRFKFGRTIHFELTPTDN